jgi:hypothetical protein
LTLPLVPRKIALMARYHQLLGRRVDVEYRAGDIILPATGTLAADSGKSIFLEEKLLQRGQEKTFRWEIPYPFLLGIKESTSPEPEVLVTAAPSENKAAEKEKAEAHPGILPLRHRSHEA